MKEKENDFLIPYKSVKFGEKKQQSFFQKNKETLLTSTYFLLSLPILFIQSLLPLTFSSSLIFLTMNILCMGLFGEIMVDSATKLSVKLSLNLFIFGLVLVPLFSSLPEDLVTIIANLKDPAIGEVMLSQILGNLLFELLVVFGIVGFLSCNKGKCMAVEKSERFSVLRNGLILFGGSLLLAGLVLFDKNLSFIDSILLIVYYIMFIAITIISKRYAKSVEKVELPEEATLDPDEINSVKAILFFVFSILLVSFFGNQFVNDILFLIDTSPTFKKFSFIYIGVIIAIPELVVSIIGIYKEKATFVLGSIIGGTIWDLVVSVSVQALVNPLSDISSQVITFFLINVIISCVISVIYIRTHWKLKMWEAICLILVYMIIIGSIIILT